MALFNWFFFMHFLTTYFSILLGGARMVLARAGVVVAGARVVQYRQEQE